MLGAMDYLNVIKDEFKKGINIVKDNIMMNDLEKKLKEATSNEHCHANVSLLNEISQKTQNFEDFRVIYDYCMKTLTSNSDQWRRILKTLFLIEHILRTGNLRFAEELKDESYRIKNLTGFSYYDGGADKGETSKFIFYLYNLYSKRKIKSYYRYN